MKKLMNYAILVLVCAVAFTITVLLLVPGEAWGQEPPDPFALPPPPGATATATVTQTQTSNPGMLWCAKLNKSIPKAEWTKAKCQPADDGADDASGKECPFEYTVIDEDTGEERCATFKEAQKLARGEMVAEAAADARMDWMMVLGALGLLGLGFGVYSYRRTNKREKDMQEQIDKLVTVVKYDAKRIDDLERDLSVE